jgi:hypothetical protein
VYDHGQAKKAYLQAFRGGEDKQPDAALVQQAETVMQQSQITVAEVWAMAAAKNNPSMVSALRSNFNRHVCSCACMERPWPLASCFLKVMLIQILQEGGVHMIAALQEQVKSFEQRKVPLDQLHKAIKLRVTQGMKKKQ